MKILAALLVLVSLNACSHAGKETTPAATKEVNLDYNVDGVVHKGFIAAPNTEGKKPGIIIVHEWWGHNDYVKNRARDLADKGYVAMSLDMYGEGKIADHPKDATAFSSAVMKDPVLLEKKFRAALAELSKHPDVDTNNIAAIGYCFGGAVVLEMAKRGLPLKAVVSIHGSLAPVSTAKAGRIKSKVLVLNGAADPFITQKDIDAFKKEMKKAKVDYEFINYEGAKHAFSNPKATEIGKKFSLPLEYNKAADIASWNKTNSFLQTTLQ
jgi:dienelactone hydrolase